jgi:hypothetical protein
MKRKIEIGHEKERRLEYQSTYVMEPEEETENWISSLGELSDFASHHNDDPTSRHGRNYCHERRFLHHLVSEF